MVQVMMAMAIAMTMPMAATTTAMRTDDNDGLQPYPKIHEYPRRFYDDVDPTHPGSVLVRGRRGCIQSMMLMVVVMTMRARTTMTMMTNLFPS